MKIILTKEEVQEAVLLQLINAGMIDGDTENYDIKIENYSSTYCTVEKKKVVKTVHLSEIPVDEEGEL